MSAKASGPKCVFNCLRFQWNISWTPLLLLLMLVFQQCAEMEGAPLPYPAVNPGHWGFGGKGYGGGRSRVRTPGRVNVRRYGGGRYGGRYVPGRYGYYVYPVRYGG